MNKVKGITAKEARYNSDNADASVDDILKSINSDIRRLASFRESSSRQVFSAKSLSINALDFIVTDLEGRGFIIHKESNENDHDLTISWKCKE